MPAISYSALTPWANFHLTTPPFEHGDGLPGIRIEEIATIHCADVAADSGIERFAATGAKLQDHLRRFFDKFDKRRTRNGGQPPTTRPYAHGMIGRAWSFSPLIGATTFQFDLAGLSGCSLLSASESAAECEGADRLALVSGGTRLREIANWAVPRGLTVPNSGTHLGATIAGLIGTSSHGSRMGFGGLQNAVHGINLITGPETSLWIERASRPVLTDESIAAMGATPVRDDAIFEDVVVHLGGMGIVNGLAIELAENKLYGLLKSDKSLPADALHMLAAGDFRTVASYLGFDEEPAFYELTIDPFNYAGPNALHIMYFDSPAGAQSNSDQAQVVRASDAVTELAQAITFGELQGDSAGTQSSADMIDAFQWLRSTGNFETGSVPFDPIDGPPSAYTWQQLHSDEISTGVPGALYNASYAIALADLPSAIPAICAALTGLPPTFVITIRFVTRAAGTMCFTRFEETAVIDVDGLSPLYWQMQAAKDPDPSHAPLYQQLAKVVPAAAQKAELALSEAMIDHSAHWAKLGKLDPARVEQGFGPSSDPGARISRWRSTRERLLGPVARRVFWNEALIQLGILDQP